MAKPSRSGHGPTRSSSGRIAAPSTPSISVRDMRSKRAAKFRFPKLYQSLPRERLFARLTGRVGIRVHWVCGPPGAGKTTLVASYLEHRDLPAIWYRMDAGDTDPGTLFYLLRKVATKMHKRAATLPLLT